MHGSCSQKMGYSVFHKFLQMEPYFVLTVYTLALQMIQTPGILAYNCRLCCTISCVLLLYDAFMGLDIIFCAWAWNQYWQFFPANLALCGTPRTVGRSKESLITK